MAKTISAVRGMNDLYGDQAWLMDQVLQTASQTARQYGYEPMVLPSLEKTALFARSIGEVTDIVEKEMYTFEDRNGESLSLRPEGTAGCVRAMIQNGRLHHQIQKVFYAGPMFRHERPQKGRYRQFHQFGVEVFGLEAAEIDAELIAMTARLWEALGLDDLVLQINSLGSVEARAQYKEVLVAYFRQHYDQLDADSQRRLETNPMRILDAKNPDMAAVIAQAPRLNDHLDAPSQAHFQNLCAYLDDLGIAYQINPNLVRGLDYYNRTVFEWVSDALGAQGTVCAGGRYDGLVEQIGGRATPAVGFALGVERLMVLLEHTQGQKVNSRADVYLVIGGETAQRPGLVLSEQIREALPQLRVQMHCGGGGLKSQFKKADKSGAKIALVLAEEEVEKQQVAVKFLREHREQESIPWDRLIGYLTQMTTDSQKARKQYESV